MLRSPIRHALGLLALLTLLALATGAHADTTAEFWDELGTSATGDGVSASLRGVVPEHRNVSVAVGPDGRPVVAHTDWDRVIVKRWDGRAWVGERIGSGFQPVVKIDAAGRIYVAWLTWIVENEGWEIYLLVRDPATGAWQELGGSASGGGITGTARRTTPTSFSLALGADGTPYIAYDAFPAAGADFTTQDVGLSADREQIYVLRWMGAAGGWAFVGSGHEGGGASNALSFRYNVDAAAGTHDVAHHGAMTPALAIGPDGMPVVTFIYTSFFEADALPEQYNGYNDDIYAARWDGTAWVALGPAVPSGPSDVGLGAAGGISNNVGVSRIIPRGFINAPGVAIGPDNRPVVVWGDDGPIWTQQQIQAAQWDGAAWRMLPGLDDTPWGEHAAVAIGPGGDPIVTWSQNDGTTSRIFALRWNGEFWVEVGIGSSWGDGISGPNGRGLLPAIAVNAAGAPTVAWIDESPGIPQAHLRTFNQRPMPDLTVTALTVPGTAGTGATISVSSTVRNTGNAAAPASLLRFYLSADGAFDTGDVLLGGRAVPALAINGVSTAATVLTIPVGTDAPATYVVIAVADPLSQVAERNEANNERVSTPLPVVLRRSDLTVTTLTPASLAAVGRPVSVTNTVRNIGVIAAGAFAVRFYLSGDDTLDAGDVLLGARALGALAVNASSVAVTPLTIPLTTEPGEYRIIAVADALEQVTELDEGNNIRASAPVTVTLYRADLTVTALTTALTGQAGRPLAVANTVRNVGLAPATAFAVRFYLSADDVLDPDDVLLGARALGGLAGNASSTATTPLMIPAGTAVPAAYRVIAVADALDQITELDEANNVRSSAPLPLTAYRADLTLTVLRPAATGQPGRALAVANTVRNAGPAPATAFTIRFYLSTDDTPDAGDVLLGARVVGALGANASSAATTPLTIPAATVIPADYRIVAVADALEQVSELDEGNNTAVSAPVPMTAYRANLAVPSVTVPPTAAAGRPMTVTNTVRNVGPAPATAFAVRFYLSSDDTLSPDDVLLGSRAVGALAAGASSVAGTVLTVPAATAVPADYRVIVVVDEAGQVTELVEDDNTMVSAPVSMTVYRADLTVTALTPAAGAQAGRALGVLNSVRNLGPAPAAAFTLRFYLSTDDTLDAGDVLLGARAFGGLAPNTTSTVTTSLVIPAATAVPADYRIIAIADAAERITELDESNNAGATAAFAIPR